MSEGFRFSLTSCAALFPAASALSQRKVGDIVNLENDVIGKYVEKLLRPAEAPTKPETKDTSITMDFLEKYGF